MGMLPGEGSIDQRMSAAGWSCRCRPAAHVRQGSLNAIRSQMAGVPSTSRPRTRRQRASGGGYATRQLAPGSSVSQARAKGDRLAPDVVVTASRSSARPAAGGSAPPRPAAPTISTPNRLQLAGDGAEREARSPRRRAQGQITPAMQMLAGKSRPEEEPGMAASRARPHRDTEVLKRQYDKLLEDREQVRLRSDVQSKTDAIDFRIIDPPSRPNVRSRRTGRCCSP
jgi:hypothetical protein